MVGMKQNQASCADLNLDTADAVLWAGGFSLFSGLGSELLTLRCSLSFQSYNQPAVGRGFYPSSKTTWASVHVQN